MTEPPRASAPARAAKPSAARFRPVQFLAKGGLGEVLVALDSELNRAVALKRILPHQADNLDARNRFALEAEITGRLEHPGIVPVYGFGCDPSTGQPYYAMRFISGQSLDAAIREFHRRPPVVYEGLAFRKLLGNFVSVCQTIGYAHSRGVIHRDIKPANVMLGEFGETLVVDWGLAKTIRVAGGGSRTKKPPVAAQTHPDPHRNQARGLSSLMDSVATEPAAANGSAAVSGLLPPEGTAEIEPTQSTQRGAPPPPEPPVSVTLPSGSETLVPSPGASSGTQVGSILGTAGYMAPEQATANVELLGPTADIYALGATLYHLLVGHRPLEGLPSTAILLRTSTGDVPTVRRLRPNVPAGLAAVCRKAMSLQPDDRYQTAGELAAEIERWLADQAVSCLPESRTARARRWARRHPRIVSGIAATIAVTGLAALAGIAVLGGLNRRLESALASAQAAQAQEARARQVAEAARAEEARARTEAEQARAAESDARRDESAARQQALSNFRLADQAIDKFLERIRARTSLFTSAELRTLRDELLESVLAYSRDVHQQKAGGDRELALALAASGKRVADVLAELGHYRESLAAAEGSALELEQLLAEHPNDHELRRQSAHNLTLQGLVHLRLGEAVRAESTYRRALELRRQLAGMASATAAERRDLGAACFNLGNAMQYQGRHDQAEPLYREALTHLLSADAADPKVEEFLLITRQYLADLLFTSGRYRQAEKFIRDNLALMNARSRRQPDDREVMFLRAEIHVQLGDTSNAGGQREVARECYNAAERLLSELVAKYPEVRQYWLELSRTHTAHGALLLSGSVADLDEAEQHFQHAVEIDRRVLRDAPTDLETLTSLGGNYCNLGITHSRREQPDRALVWLDRAVETLTAVCMKSHNSDSPKRFLLTSRRQRAKVLGEMGRHESAAADWQKLVELTDGAQRTQCRLGLATSLASAGQHNRAGEVMEKAQSEVADIERLMDTARAWVHCARRLSADVRVPEASRTATVERYFQHAVGNIRRAGELGLRDAEDLEKNPDLEPLLTREDFRRVLKEIAGRSP